MTARRLVTAVAIAALLLGPASLVQAPPSTPDGGQDSCIDAGCHAKQVSGKVVHAAAAAGACDSCHAAAGETGHVFEIAADPIGALCTTCHDDPVAGRAHVHGAVGDGACTTCHDPHASEQPHLLIEAPGALCVGCHADLEESLVLASVHEPAREPGCTTCHDPHASDHRALLAAEGNAVCLECHTAGRGHPVARHPIEGASDPRRPGRPFGCASCHDPHGSARRALLRGPAGTGFCRQCHRK